VGISRDYPLKTRTSKQPIGEIPGYEIIPSHPLKYPRSKQGLKKESLTEEVEGKSIRALLDLFSLLALTTKKIRKIIQENVATTKGFY
jgi:hypothetical protein